MCDVGYLCVNFVFLGLSVLDLRPDVRDRLTSDRQTSDAHHRLMPGQKGKVHHTPLRERKRMLISLS